MNVRDSRDPQLAIDLCVGLFLLLVVLLIRCGLGAMRLLFWWQVGP